MPCGLWLCRVVLCEQWVLIPLMAPAVVDKFKCRMFCIDGACMYCNVNLLTN